MSIIITKDMFEYATYTRERPRIEIDIITEESGFLELEHIWNFLVQKSNIDNIFLTFEWLSTWWRHFGQGNKLFITVVKNQGRIVGLVPLMITSYEGFRQLSMIGGKTADYKDFIITEDQDRESIIEAILNAVIKEKSWDFFQLRGFCENSPNLSQLRATLSCFQDYRPVCYEYDNSLYIPIDMPWESYFNTLTTGFRKDSRRRMRLLNREGRVPSYYCPADKREVNFYMDELIKQHILYWKEIKREYSIFEHPAMVSFCKDLAERLFAKNWLNLNVLLLNGEITAIDFGFEYANKYFPYMGVFKHEFSNYSVSRFLRLHVLKGVFNRGLREIDLLRGDESYKFDFNPKMRKLYCVALFQKSLRGYTSEKWFLRLRPKLETLVQTTPLHWRLRKVGFRRG